MNECWMMKTVLTDMSPPSARSGVSYLYRRWKQFVARVAAVCGEQTEFSLRQTPACELDLQNLQEHVRRPRYGVNTQRI